MTSWSNSIMNVAEKGILYCAVGSSKYFEEAIDSAKSVRQFCPDVKISVFTDNIKYNHPVFTNIIPIEKQNGFLAKIDAISQCIYSKNLFLDTDTAIIGNCIPQLFMLLDRFDLALTHAPFWQGGMKMSHIPICFPELNTGVILYNSNLKKFLKLWKSNYQNFIGKTHDQPILRDLLYREKISFYVLPPEFNMRPFSYSKNDRTPYILHWHGASKYYQQINQKNLSTSSKKSKITVF